jgi:hypothetical protein
VEGLADRKGDDARAGVLRMHLAIYFTGALTVQKGYNILEDEMTMSLEAFADKYGREDGEPECVQPTCDSTDGGTNLSAAARALTSPRHRAKKC